MTDLDELVRACKWAEASDLALARGERVRAFEIALEGRDLERLEQIARALDEGEEPRAIAAAMRRNDRVAEGLVHAAKNRFDDAARAFEEGSNHLRAARAHRSAGRDADAGRALETHLRDHPQDDAACAELAELCLAMGRPETALRVLRAATGSVAKLLAERAKKAVIGLDAEAEALASPWLFGRYEVLREVATTATSRVLEAIDRLEPGGPHVALKVFVGSGQTGAGRDALMRFEREVRIAAALDAPSVLRPKAFLPEGPTLVLPWLGGGSVQMLLDRGPLPPRRAAEIADRVLLALASAHRRGIVHRDVKPSNVLLDEAGGAFLSDFGVAHLGDAGATATAGMLGTARYMAPEQRSGEPATAASDLYAVGILLGEMLGDPSLMPAPMRELLASLTAEAAKDRLASADEARRAIAVIAWPDDPFGRAASIRTPAAEGEQRFVDETEGVFLDTLLERRERRVPSESALARALLSGEDATLPSILGRVGDELRVEIPEGDEVSEQALTPEERGGLEGARARLAALGVAARCVRTRRGLRLAL